jgi:YesN/AraC family two-component response regulator
VVSDIMMPRMDGCELCNAIKEDLSLSHIPVLLLTAAVGVETHIRSLKSGADAYIEKPFSLDYLQACIDNLLSLRTILIQKFSQQPLTPITEIASTPLDSDFLSRLEKLIEENFSNSELNVDFLAQQLGISRSGFFAKIKTLANASPNEMIQMIRLKHAARLLKQGQYRVSEVCYMVGFNSPSYFSKCFQKQFGIKPTDFAAEQNP